MVACGSESYLAKGLRYSKLGKDADARIQFRKAIQKDPRLGKAYYYLGLLDFKEGKVAAALADFQQAALLMPADLEVEARLADLELGAYLADPQRSKILYARVDGAARDLLKKDAGSYAGLRLEGYLAMADSKPERAVEYFQRALLQKREEPDLSTALVQNLLLANRAAEAERVAIAFIQAHKSYGPIYDILYNHYIASHRPADAEQLLKTKIANNPNQGLYVMELARHDWDRGKREEATKLLNVVASDPHFSNGILDAGDFYAERGEWARALEQYRAGAQNQAQRSLYEKRITRALIALNRRDQAAAFLDEIIRRDPSDNEARSSRVSLWLTEGREEGLRQAIAELQKLLQRDPANIAYRYELGNAFEREAKYSDADAQYLLVVQKQPDHIPALLGLAQNRLRNRQFNDAQHYAEEVLRRQPENSAAILVRTACLAAFGRFDETRAALGRLTRDHPEIKEARLQMGLLNLLQKRYSTAEQEIRTLYQPGSEDTRAVKALVEIYKAKHVLDNAISMLQEELRRRPGAVELRLLLASTATEAGNLPLAASEYERLQAADPASPEITVELGHIYLLQGYLEKAVDRFERAAQLAPRDPSPPALLGEALDQLGRKHEAIAQYRRSLALKPSIPLVMNNLAYLIAETGGDLEEASRLASAALRQQPADLRIADTVGWIHLQKKDFTSALDTFQNLVRRDPSNPTLRMHLGMTLKSTGKGAAAQAQLEAALSSRPSPAEASEIRGLLDDWRAH